MDRIKSVLVITILTSCLIGIYSFDLWAIEYNNSVHFSDFPTDKGQGLLRNRISKDEQERRNESIFTPPFSVNKNVIMKKAGFISRELLVKFKGDPKLNNSSNIMPIALNNNLSRLKIEKLFPSLNSSNISYQSSAIQYQAQTNNLSHWYKVTIPEDVDIYTFIEEYKNNEEIEFIEPNYIYKVTVVPNDNYYNSWNTWGQSYQDSWGLHKIYAQEAWDIETGSDEIIVAVVDTGLDYNHQDIISNIWVNEDEIPGNYIDDDGNGYVDDVQGWNFIKCSDDIKDGHGHGTHLAGIIAATTNNSIGISGVSWNSKIMALKSLNDDGYGITADLAEGIRYAVDNGARVINMSWGGAFISKLITEALDYAYAKGCVLVVAAGNFNSDAVEFFPANYKKAITVSAIDPNDQKAVFSNYGDVIDVSAPGVDVLSLRAEGTDMYKDNIHIVNSYYYRASGTSMAAPYVTGLAALILSNHPDFSNEEVSLAIIYSTDDLGIAGKDNDFGEGRINIYRALEIAEGNFPPAKGVLAIDTPGDSGHSITVLWDKNDLFTEVKGYRVYYSNRPFKSIYDEGVVYFENSPAERADIFSCNVTNLGDETGSYYFAVIANIFDFQPNIDKKSIASAFGDISPMGEQIPISDSSLISTTQPVYPVDNIINTTSGDDIIVAGTDLQTKVIIPQGTNNGKILDVVIPLNVLFNYQQEKDSTLRENNNENVDNFDYLNSEILEMTTREFNSSEPINGKVNIVLSYPSLNNSSYEDNLRIYELNKFSGNWEILPDIQSVNTDIKVVMTAVDGSNWHTGAAYRLFITRYASADLGAVKVYPNPYKPNSGLGHSKIIFDNLTENAKIKMFNIAGELVTTIEEEDTDGREEWEATNDNNEKLASGIYIYVISNDKGNKKTGKIAIIK